jgi:RNA polymerase sigma-70 factor (ECF subfamily)
MSAEIETETTLAGALVEDRDVRLVEAARKGDEAAIREIYRTYREPVWALAVSLLGDPLQAQDIVQSVFFKAFRGLRGFRFRSTLFTWIYRIARNECRSQARRCSVKSVPLESILGSRYEADAAPADGSDEARADVLRSAVAGLPFKLREVVVLKYQEGLSYDEMSRVLGRPSGTVASRLNRALAELEVRLRPGGGPR